MSTTKRTSERLIPALRQYLHNDGSGLVTAYDKEEVEKVFASKQAEIEGLRSELASHERLAAKGVYMTEDEYLESLTLKKKEAAMAMINFLNHTLSSDADSRGRIPLPAVLNKGQFFIDRIVGRDDLPTPDELSEKIRKEADFIHKIAAVFPVLCNESEQGKQFLINLAENWSEEYKKELGV